jgi:lipopolysaccharide export system ATP-binding protein
MKIKKFKITKYKKEIKPILQMKNISKKYDQRHIINNLKMDIMPSSITGLLGPNGSGKTTLFNLLLGIVKVDSGKIIISPDGKKMLPLENLPIHERCKKYKIGFIPQNESLFRGLSCEDNLKGIGEILLKDKRKIDEKVENLLSEFSLFECRKTLASDLSGGQKKKLSIARALIDDCRILFMDEIFSAVDPITIEMIKDVIVKLQVTRNITILISDHAFENVLQIADNIKILSEGQIVSEGSPSNIVKDVSARKVYFGDSY